LKTDHRPRHVAIIMDGNGRWAELRNRDRAVGHLKGARVAKQVIEHCANSNIKFLTLYAFSTENWLRPKEEVAFLMRLLARHLKRERSTLVKNNIRFSVIGELDRLPDSIVKEVRLTIEETKSNTGMHLVFAISYGGRQEIAAAVRTIAQQVATGSLRAEDINETLISNSLQSSFLPDPDLIIRTSGEYRLSNFLIWQSAYSELYFTNTLWPDFKPQQMEDAFSHYAKRERRFGKTAAQLQSEPGATPISSQASV
jgi:undecaprenyl diphosphate synthase